MRQLGNDLFLLDFEEIRRTLYCNFRSATRNFSGFTLSVEFYKRNLNLKTRLNYNWGSFCCCISSKKSEKLHRVHLDSKFNMFRKVKLFGEPLSGAVSQKLALILHGRSERFPFLAPYCFSDAIYCIMSDVSSSLSS